MTDQEIITKFRSLLKALVTIYKQPEGTPTEELERSREIAKLLLYGNSL